MFRQLYRTIEKKIKYARKKYKISAEQQIATRNLPRRKNTKKGKNISSVAASVDVNVNVNIFVASFFLPHIIPWFSFISFVFAAGNDAALVLRVCVRVCVNFFATVAPFHVHYSQHLLLLDLLQCVIKVNLLKTQINLQVKRWTRVVHVNSTHTYQQQQKSRRRRQQQQQRINL